MCKPCITFLIEIILQVLAKYKRKSKRNARQVIAEKRKAEKIHEKIY